MNDELTFTIPTIADIQVFDSRGPWQTKSDGQLNVLFAINYQDLQQKYFHYEDSELNKIPRDIRGLRSYRVSGLRTGVVGAHEWHRVRKEIVIVTQGSIKWICEDTQGSKTEYILDSTRGIWTPPFILHTYEALEDDTELLVIANTLFFPDEPTTHDTFSPSDFYKIREHS